MSRARCLYLSAVALAAFAGCRTGGIDNLSRRDPVLPPTTIDAREVIAEHNRNAERVTTLEASPELKVTAEGRSYGVEGRLALERPRNFRLDLRHTTGEVGEIGSNDDEFWFWLRESKDKAVYYCNYDESGATPLVSAFQPDWIVESLGLRVISPDELGDYETKRGTEPGTVELTHRATKVGGESVVRVTVISETTRRIKEHRLYAANGKTLLARASIQSYMKVVPDDAKAGAGDEIDVPQTIRIEWVREKLAMEATLYERSTKVNVKFSEERRQARFVEAKRKGYARVNLADAPGFARSANTTRETRPSPPAGVELGAPEAQNEPSSRRPRDQVALSDDLPMLPSVREELVGPAIPKAPGIEFAQPGTSGSRWRNTSVPVLER